VQPVAATGLDSSYLKIGIEQGPIVMVLFITALLALLVGLAVRAIATPDPTAAALGIGACGTVVALLVFFYTGFYVEHLQTLSAWLLIGIGAAQFTGSRAFPRRPVRGGIGGR
jgi:riboflavin transporter FmnP